MDSKLKRETIGGSLRHNSVLVLVRIRSLRITGCMSAVFIPLLFAKKMSWMEVISPDVLNGFLGFLVVDPLSHNIFPQGWGGVYMRVDLFTK